MKWEKKAPHASFKSENEWGYWPENWNWKIKSFVSNETGASLRAFLIVKNLLFFASSEEYNGYGNSTRSQDLDNSPSDSCLQCTFALFLRCGNNLQHRIIAVQFVKKTNHHERTRDYFCKVEKYATTCGGGCDKFSINIWFTMFNIVFSCREFEKWWFN